MPLAGDAGTRGALRERALPTAGPLAFTIGNWFTWTAVGIGFPGVGISLVAVARLLARGAWEAPPVLASTHIATLGWVTMTIIGAAAQMAPALLGARVRGEATLPYLYGVFTVSAALLVVGFLGGRFVLAAVGGAGVALASLWFVALMLWTARAARSRPASMPLHLPVAFVCLGLVTLWGTMLAANLSLGFWPGLLVGHRGLVVHLALGLGGWFGLMVVGTFYRLVPLIHGARVASRSRGLAVLLLAGWAIVSTFGGVAGRLDWSLRVAALSAAAALVLLAVEVGHVLQHRRSRAPDLNVRHWYAVLGYSIVLAGVAVAWSLGAVRSGPPDRLGECVAVLFLLGWVTQAVIGQLYKIAPFLMWYYRSTIPDVPAISRRPDLYSPPVGSGVFWASNTGVVLMTIGIWERAATIAEAGAVAIALSAFGLAYMLAYRWIPPVLSGRLAFEWRWRIS